MAAEVCTDVLGSDLWEETRRSLMSPPSWGCLWKCHYLDTSSTTTECKYSRWNATILQFNISQSVSSVCPKEAVMYWKRSQSNVNAPDFPYPHHRHTLFSRILNQTFDMCTWRRLHAGLLLVLSSTEYTGSGTSHIPVLLVWHSWLLSFILLLFIFFFPFLFLSLYFSFSFFSFSSLFLCVTIKELWKYFILNKGSYLSRKWGHICL